MNKKHHNLIALACWPKSADMTKITDVTTQLQGAQNHDIVFYRLSSQKSEVLLKERLKSSSPGVLVTYGAEPLADLNGAHLHLTEEKARKLLIEVSEILYPLKNKKHTLIGITGTNGKSSCVWLCAQMAAFFRENCFSLGTLGLRKGNGEVLTEGTLTTPGHPELRKVLHELPDESTVFLEVSSHALQQNRVQGLKFCVGGWTNFGYDHLDYHQNLENYFGAKAKIFDFCKAGVFTLNSQKELNQKLSSFDLTPHKVPLLDLQEVRHLSEIFEVQYNLENLSLSKSIVEKVIGQKIDLKTFDKLNLPPGRMTTLQYESKLIVVDYAHTPDALDNVCQALKKSFPSRELWVVFGCGGDRDTTKRPLMRKMVEKHTPHMIITSDNPRTESPQKIIEDILMGASEKLVSEVDRAAAIKKGVQSSPQNAVVLIAGKGHEQYQEIGSERFYFSDIDTVKKIIQGA